MYTAYDMYVCVFIIYDLFQHFIVSINMYGLEWLDYRV